MPNRQAIIDARHRSEVGLAADNVLQRVAVEPKGVVPVHPVLGGEGLGGEVAVCALCLLHRRHRGGEELRKELWILQS